MHVFFLLIPLVHCAGTIHGQSLMIECDTLRIQSNLNSPWNIEPLTENQLLLTERAGTVWKVDLVLGERSELHTFENVAMEGQSGLLGSAVHPSYPEIPELFFALTHYDEDWNVVLRVDKLLLDPANESVIETNTIIDGIQVGQSSIGGRMFIDNEAFLWLTCGVADNNPLAQDQSSPNGKILRYNLDGSIPAGQPFPQSPVYTLGHRNPQGICQSASGLIFTSEHGAFSNDEVNSVAAGRNYGWPLTSGPCTTSNQNICDEINMKEPLISWTPNIAPSGMAAFGNELVPAMPSGLLVSSLAGKSLRLLDLSEDETTIDEEYILLEEWIGRIRDVTVTPDNRVFVITSNTDFYGVPEPGDDRLYEVTLDVTVGLLPDPDPQKTLRAYIDANTLFIQGLSADEAARWELYTTSGQRVQEGVIYGGASQTLKYPLSSGTYILRVTTSQMTVSKKIVVAS